MKAAIIGANGQLGVDLCVAFARNDHGVVQINHSEVDIRDMKNLRAVLGSQKPDLIVNTAAMHNVDACERDPLSAYEVNGIGARNLALICQERDIPLMHVSTDYVFDGTKNAPYVEDDQPMPLNVYGNTKLSGEYFIRSIAPRHYIVRVSGLYGLNPCRAKAGRNFVSLMLDLAREGRDIRVVDDEILSPTYTMEVAEQMVKIAESSLYGLYHATSEGFCSWYEFAQEIFRLAGLQPRLERAAPGEFVNKVPRPKYSVLENARLKQNMIHMMGHWRQGLESYLDVFQRGQRLESSLR
jgi:dTDP-4-dehydrorhamnose reductase